MATAYGSETQTVYTICSPRPAEMGPEKVTPRPATHAILTVFKAPGGNGNLKAKGSVFQTLY